MKKGTSQEKSCEESAKKGELVRGRQQDTIAGASGIGEQHSSGRDGAGN